MLQRNESRRKWYANIHGLYFTNFFGYVSLASIKTSQAWKAHERY